MKPMPSHLNHLFSEIKPIWPSTWVTRTLLRFQFCWLHCAAYWKLGFLNNTLIAITKTFCPQCAAYWKFIFWTVVLLIFFLSCWWCFSYVVNALSFQALTKAGICNAQSTDNPLSLWSLPVLIEHNVRFRQFPFRFYCKFLNFEQGVKLNHSFTNKFFTEVW